MSESRVGETIRGPLLRVENHLRDDPNGHLHNLEHARTAGFPDGVVGVPNYLSFASALIEERLALEPSRGVRLRARFPAPVYGGDHMRALITVGGAAGGFSAEFTVEREDGRAVATGGAELLEAGREPARRDGAAEPQPTRLVALRDLEAGERLRSEFVAEEADVLAFRRRNHDRFERERRVPLAYLAASLWRVMRFELLDERGVPDGIYASLDLWQQRPLASGRRYGFEGEVLTVRARGDVEILESRLAALDERGEPACVATHTYLVPLRDALGAYRLVGG